MDTPNCPPPATDSEMAILAELTLVRDKLLLLKSDRTTYIRSQDVIPLYQEVLEQVRRLNEIRGELSTPHAETQVDRVLESCLQLISLLFMTVGRISEAPAAYALSSTIKRLLVHLAEANLYCAKDLESLSGALERVETSIDSAPADESPYIVELLKKRLTFCRLTLTELKTKISHLEDPLPEIHEKLISILRSLALANTRSRFSVSEVKKFSHQIVEIAELRKDEHFQTEDGRIPEGDADVNDTLERCVRWAEIVAERRGIIPEPFQAIYADLYRVRVELDKLSLTQAWALRETDLYDFQRLLDRIDEQRVNGNWLDSEGRPAELYVQRTLLYLLRRGYAYIYKLMMASEPVSEALLPVFNQLQTLKRCLVEVREHGGVSSVRELYPYSMKLNSLDNMRKDGKFMVNGDIPEGQGTVCDLLAECFDINYELQLGVEANAAAEAAEEEAAAAAAAAAGSKSADEDE